MMPKPNPTKIAKFIRFIAAGLLMAVFVFKAPAMADPAVRVEKMTYAELNRLITEGDCNCLMVFMAAWCGPCKEELPELNRLYRRFADQGVRFIGISVDEGGPAAIEKVIAKQKVAFPVYWVGDTAVDNLQIFGIPMIFIIKRGQIVEKIPGKCSYEFLETKILDLLKPSTAQ
jgi:thiol-disulfide isomerase/thioredoxin